MTNYSLKILEEELEHLKKLQASVVVSDNDPIIEELNEYRIKDLENSVRILKQLTE